MTISGSQSQIELLVEKGVIEPMCDLLAVTDPQVIQVVLDGLNNILKSGGGMNYQPIATMIEQCGGLDKIEALQNHENEDIYQLAYDIIDKYFSDLDDGDDSLAPAQGESGFQFSSSSNPPSNVPSQGFQF